MLSWRSSLAKGIERFMPPLIARYRPKSTRDFVADLSRLLRRFLYFIVEPLIPIARYLNHPRRSSLRPRGAFHPNS